MKQAFLLLFYIIVSAFIADKIIYYLLNKAEERIFTGQGIGKLNYFFQIKDTTNYIIFGSSRANHHLDPSVLGRSAFNMGLDGSKMAYSAALIKTLPHNKKQVVFLHIDPSFTFDLKYKGEDIKELYSKYTTNKLVKQEIDRIGMNNPFSIFFWSLDYNYKIGPILTRVLSTDSNTKHDNGFDPLTVDGNHKEILTKILHNRKVEPCSSTLKPSPLVMNYLKDIKRFCDENNKILIAFTSPECIDDCKKDNIAMEKLLENLNIKYYDFTDLFITEGRSEYWKDKNHLSRQGAEIFSQHFYKNVL